MSMTNMQCEKERAEMKKEKREEAEEKGQK